MKIILDFPKNPNNTNIFVITVIIFFGFMEQSEREDYLEAIIMHSVEGKGRETSALLSSVTGKDEEEVVMFISALEEDGDLLTEDDGSILLTDKGRSTGESVLKKHRTLECFFTEMLGMDPDTASREACEIEHSASDYTINKLGRFLSGRGARCRAGNRADRTGGHFPGKLCNYKVIDDFEEGEVLRVVGMRGGPGGGRRLIDLGIVPGEEIRIIRKLPGKSVLVLVKGSEVAISSEIVGRVVVERAD